MAKMRKTVKMADIAERLSVSTVTVSKALSGQKGVSEEMRIKIQELADEMGYKAPSATKEKKPKRGYNIGILISGRYLANYVAFYWKMYQDVASEAMQKECFTLFEILNEEMEEKKLMPRLLEEKKVDGLIVIGKPGYGYTDFLRKNASLPLVFLDFYERDAGVDCFISDGFYGTYVLTNYLFDKGHEDIAYVGTLFATDSITDRFMGYAKSMMEHGKEVTKEYLIDDRNIDSGLQEQYGIFNFPEKMPTALVCNCDFIASQVIKYLTEKGYRVPEDVSVVGFDNYLYPGLCDVDITTYSVDIKAMSKAGIETLLKKLDGENYKKGIHIVEGHLIEKDSVAERK